MFRLIFFFPFDPYKYRFAHNDRQLVYLFDSLPHVLFLCFVGEDDERDSLSKPSPFLYYGGYADIIVAEYPGDLREDPGLVKSREPEIIP